MKERDSPACRGGVLEDGIRNVPAGAASNRTGAAVQLATRAREVRGCANTSSSVRRWAKCARRATSRAGAMRRMSHDDVYGAAKDHHGQWFFAEI